MNFSESERKLCREIAETWRKTVGFGDWYLDYLGEPRAFIDGDSAILDVGMFPLLTLDDAVQEIERHGWEIIDMGVLSYNIVTETKLYAVRITKFDDHRSPRSIRENGSTLREAALKCLLEIVKEERG